MNRIPKYKTKNNVSRPYIKVTKKELIEKNNLTNDKVSNNNNQKKKLNITNNDLKRKFGEDISNKIKNSISPNIIHNQKNRASQLSLEEKVNYFNFIIYIFHYIDSSKYKYS